MGKEELWNNNKKVNNSTFKKITLCLSAQNSNWWLIKQAESFSNSEQEEKKSLHHKDIQREFSFILFYSGSMHKRLPMFSLSGFGGTVRHP